MTALALLPRAGLGAGRSHRRSSSARGSGSRSQALTELALRGRPDQVVHGGWTIAARHAGVVLGLVLLAPVLTTALEENRDEAIRAGAAVVLDSDIPPLDKLGVAQDVLDEVDRAEELGELPDVERAFEGRPDDEEWRALTNGLQEQLDRAVTSAFSGPFLLAAVLTLCALVPVALHAEAPGVRRFVPFLVALGLVAAVVVPYLALGGGRFEPTPVADPCETREQLEADGLGETIERDRALGGRRRRVRARRFA